MSLTSMLFLLVFLGLGWLSMSKDPVYGIGCYILLYFFAGQWWWQSLPNLPYSKIAIFFTLVGMVSNWNKYKAKAFDYPPTKWIFALGVLSLLIIPFAIDSYHHNFYASILWKNILVFWILIKVVENFEKLNKILYFFICGAFYLSFTAFQQGRNSGGRLEGIGVADGQDSNLCAAALVVAVPIVLSLMYRAKGKEKLFLSAAFVFILNALILYNSRGAFLALVLAAIVLGINFFRKIFSRKGERVKLTLAAGFAVCAFFYLADQTFWDRMRTLEDTSTEGSGYRMLIWQSALDVLADYPFGTGADGFTLISHSYIPPEMVSSTGTRAMHNTYLQALTEYGVIGFLVFLSMIGSVFIYTARARKFLIGEAEKFLPVLFGLEAAFAAHLFAAIFINRLYSEVLYWLPALIAVAGGLTVLGLNGKDENISCH
ncbi:MAG: O-antigen ligase family protein [Desulfuromonadales bacterium]|nr:O-antigen ligase family protein [Desulfuromonadales bacterium]